jgi:ribosomal protein S27AE
MPESSIKETMDRLYGVGTIPRKKIPAEEMKRLIAESKVQLRAKKGKSIDNKKTESAEGTEKGCIDNHPCPRCKEIGWMKIPDETGRYYCLKCGYVEEPEKITREFKSDRCRAVTKFPGKDLEFEEQVEPISSTSNQINEGDKNMEDIFCEFSCDKCQAIVLARGKGLERAQSHTVIHEGCGGTLTFLRQISPDEFRKRSAVHREDYAVIDKFYHPKSGKFVCNNCPDRNNCSQSDRHMETCLLINIDLKMKHLLIRLTELLEILSKNKTTEGDDV